MEKDYKKEIKDLMYLISPEKKAEDFLNENYSNQWKKIPKEEKKSFIEKFIEYSNPSKMKEINNLLKKHEGFENKKFDFVILFFGILFGIGGNLVANLLDKYFSYLGYIYYIFIIIIFILSFWIIYNFFIRKTAKEIKDKENSIELLKIIEKIENYK